MSLIKRRRRDLTAERLRELLVYNPDTGIFTRRVDRKRYKAGTVIGRPGRGYWLIDVDGITHVAHRLAWLYVHGEWPSELDHINRNGLDNRLSNLRVATSGENQRNIGLRSDNKSGYKGVHFHKKSGRWRAQIWVAGKGYTLGLQDTAEEAFRVRCAALPKYHGEFACDGAG